MLLSLFCGPGGLDFGFQEAGFETRLAFDIDQDSVNTFNKNIRGQCAHRYDVNELTVDVIDELFNGTFNPVGIIGGPPCQSFSISNVHQNEIDQRHDLPLQYAQLLTELNNRSPIQFFVFENVPGLIRKKHKERFNKFTREFAKAGFRIYTNLLNAKSYGVPQNRERVIVVGINKISHPEIEWIPPINTYNGFQTVRDTIERLPEPIHFQRSLKPEDIPFHPNHWCMAPKSEKFRKAGAITSDHNRRSFRKLEWDKPSPTVAYGHREVHVHPNSHRRLSVYEAMLLQGFPKGYVLKGTLSSQIAQVSEAVPPPMARAIAQSINKIL